MTLHNKGFKCLLAEHSGHKMEGNVFVIGSGTSEGVPIVSCLTSPDASKCPTCQDTRTNQFSKNRRRNTCVAIHFTVPKDQYLQCKLSHIQNHSEETQTNEKSSIDTFVSKSLINDTTMPITILVDAGKFFYQSCIELFPRLGLRNIDAVLITHDHFDAIGGLDDLRDWTQNISPGIALPLFSTERDYATMSKGFSYLTHPQSSTGGGGIPRIDFFPTLKPFLPIDIYGVQIIPLPVFHGTTYISLGFRFGDVVYISDCSRIPFSTTEFIIGKDALESENFDENLCKSDFPSVDWTDEMIDIRKRALSTVTRCRTLVVDCLSPHENVHPSHFNLPHTIEYLKSLPEPKPEHIYFTGMCHKINYEQHSLELEQYRSCNLNISLLYDGFSFPFTA